MLTKRNILFLLIISLGLPLAGQNVFDAISLTYGETGAGSKGISQAGANVAMSNDYYSLYWNPAGLTLLQKSQFVLDISHQSYNNEAVFAGSSTDETWRYTRLRSIGFAIPLPTTRGSAVLAFGYNRIHEMDQNLIFSGFNTASNGLSFSEISGTDTLDFPFDKDLQQTEHVLNEGSIGQWSFGGAIALSPKVNVGISFDFINGSTEYQWDYLQEDTQNNFSVFPGDYYSYELIRIVNTDYSAFGIKTGANIQISPALKAGINVGLPVTYTVEENYGENDILTYDDGYEDAYDYGNGRYKYKIKMPFYFDAGLAFTGKLLSVEAGMRYRDWSQLRFETEDDGVESIAGDNELLALNNDIADQLRATVNYHLGGEIAIPAYGLKIRGGYAYKPVPLKDMDTDMDRKYFTFGLAYEADQYVTFNLSFVRASWKQFTEDAYTPGGTEENINKDQTLLGIIYNF